MGVTASGCGWRCHRCQAVGDTADLVAYALAGCRSREATAEQADEARAWAADRGLVEPGPGSPPATARVPYSPPPPRVEAPPRYPSADLVREARRHLEAIPPPWPWWRGRGYGDAREARVAWRPHGGGLLFVDLSSAYLLVLPLCDHTGATRSYHLRRIDGGTPKTRNPTGYSVAALAFLDRVAHAGAAGGEMPSAIVVEGVTDYLYACSIAPPDVAVIGGISGSWPILSRLRWRPDARVIIATDGDGPGDLYAQAIAEGLARSPSPPADVARVRPPEGSDLDAWRPTWASLAS
ncbi:MAG: hypothetical protein ACO3GM_04200 [Candidatus Limnocylindrus sp.]